MGAGRKTQTIIATEKTQPTSTVNSSVSARNLPKSELLGGIFVCSHATMGECFKKQLFGLPESHHLYIKKIVPGLRLFLFNYSDRKLHGIFEAISHGQLNIDPSAWTDSGSGPTPFPAQVKFHVREKCQPLVEDQFRQILAKNYYDDKHFWFELDEEQTAMLVSLFSSLPDRSRTTSATAREEVIRRTNRANAPCNEQAPKDELDLPQAEDWGDQVDDPQPKRDEHKVAQSSSAHFYSSATSGLNTSSPHKLWSALFKNEVPSAKTKESEDTDYNSAVDESNLEFGGTSNTSHCFKTRRECLEAVKGTEYLEEEHLSSDSQHDSSFSSPGVTASVEALLKDDQVPACGPVETEIKSSDLLNTVSKLSQDLEAMKLVHSSQSLKIRSLEQKLDKSECKFKKVEEWFFKLQSTFTPDVDEHDSMLKLHSYIHQELDKSVVIAGGFDDSLCFSSLVSYSPSKDLMTFLSDMTGPRSFASAVNLNGEFCIIGGSCGDNYFKTVELYRAVNKSWISLPSLNREKGGLGAISLDGKIYTVGGGITKECFSEVEVLDPNAGRWIPAKSMHHKRCATAAAEINGALYAVGGYDGKDILNSTERFDPRVENWTRIANMNMKRGWHSLVVLNEKLYALGGVDGNSTLLSVEVFDPRAGLWLMERPMRVPREKFGAAAIGDRIYVFGGQSCDDLKIETVESFRSGRGWLETGLECFGKRCGFTAVVL